jgi:hypothetical protein
MRDYAQSRAFERLYQELPVMSIFSVLLCPIFAGLRNSLRGCLKAGRGPFLRIANGGGKTHSCRCMADEAPGELSGPVQLPITGELDLHTFRPQDVKDVVPAYLEACQEKGILVLRIVHGKGIGNLRRTVQAILGHHPAVAEFSAASEWMGGWGAMMVRLKAKG